MLSLNACDKDLQPVRANCQKLLMFTSEFLGLVYICEPRDWLACSAGPRTNRLWHHLRGAQIAKPPSISYVCVCACGCVRGITDDFAVGSLSVFCFVIYHVKESKVSKRWQISNMCNQLSSTNDPRSFFLPGLLSAAFSMQERDREQRKWWWWWGALRV